MGKKSGGGGDSAGAARIQGEMDRKTARDVTYADRPDQFNPWSNVTWGQESVVDPSTVKNWETDPTTGEQVPVGTAGTDYENVTKWTQNVNLTPEAKGLYDRQMDILSGRGDLAAGMNDRISAEMGAPVDWNQFGDVAQLQYDPTAIRGAAEDAAYQRETNRLDPRFAAERSAMESKLANQGLRAGDQAYDASMTTFNASKDDAYERARLGATDTGMREAQQLWDQQMGSTNLANSLRDKQISEYLGKRQFSLGEQNALREGGDIGSLVKVVTGA